MPINRYSARITQPKSQGASQAQLYAIGFTETDMGKAQVGIASVWYEGNNCNMHLLDLASDVKQGIEEHDMKGLRFNTVGVSDGMSMGTEGMSYSLQSRDLIADSIETVMRGQWYDGLIAIPGCDKNLPGCLMAMARVNRPSLMIYGGTIRLGYTRDDQPLDIASAFQSYGAYIAKQIDDQQRREIVRRACPGAGACGGMYTANTMATAIETMGMSLPYSSSTPATEPQKRQECLQVGPVIRRLLEQNLRPSDIMTAKSFENAMTMIMALGGSTNAVLHLIAMARAVGLTLGLDDFQRVSERTPFIANIKPSGRYVMENLHKVGGVPAVMKNLLEEGLLHGDCITVTGLTVSENLATVPSLASNQSVIRPINNPIKSNGHIRILRGNLAPGGAVAKITGKEGLHFQGRANVFDSEEAMLKALEDNQIVAGDVVVIRYEGPKGGPGMPEMLTPTSAVVGAGLKDNVALITDGRFSGASHGFIIGHIVPEAQEGGPIALVETGDTITIDAQHNKLSVEISDEDLAKRRTHWQPPPYKASRGTLYKYIKTVSDASHGCVTDE